MDASQCNPGRSFPPLVVWWTLDDGVGVRQTSTLTGDRLGLRTGSR